MEPFFTASFTTSGNAKKTFKAATDINSFLMPPINKMVCINV